MTNVVMRVVRATKFAGVLALALAAAACANRPNDPQAGGSAPPGSQQDFVVNVGDRVFFESDSSELTSQSIATLEKQAQWLQVYNQYTFTIEGHADERGTREYNIALGARRQCATISLRAGLTRNACAPSPMARNGRSRCATIFHAGRKIAARSRCSTPAPDRRKRGGRGQPAPSGAGCVLRRQGFPFETRDRNFRRRGVARR